jgi:hypothetical protein
VDNTRFNRTEILQIVYDVDEVIRPIAKVYKKRWKDIVDTVDENIVEYRWNYKRTQRRVRRTPRRC